MKIQFFESEFGTNIDMEPETIEEATALLRMANNSSREPADVRFYFSSKTPTASVWLKKVKKSAQCNSISNTNNNRK